MTSWNTLIGLCLRDSGVAPAGLSPSAQMQADTILRLQMMLDEWASNRLYVYHLVDLAFVCTGAQSYTVGPGGNFNVPRLPKIEDAFLRQVVPAQPAQVDFPLTILQAREDYDRIRLKNLKASPSSAIFFDSGYPMGLAYPVPIPSSSYELHLIVRAQLDQVGEPTAEINLPSMYNRAIYSNLCVALCAAHRREVHPAMARLATTTMKSVKRANTQIPTAQMPRGLVRGPSYNIFSDEGG